MWLANAYAWDWLRFTLNGSLTLVGTFLIFFYGLRPTNVLGAGGISGLFAQLMDRDGSQGVAAGPALLYRAVLWIGFSYFMLGITLTTWSMQESPGMFWLAYLSIIGLALVSQLMQWKGRWAPLIAGAYLLGCLGFAVWETTLSNNFEAATGETWFDDDTGKAVIVGYYSQGKFIPDPRGRSAAKCEASPTGCFYKGIRLVTPTPDDAPDTSGFGINRIIDGVTKTPAERTAEEVAEQEKIDAANKRRSGTPAAPPTPKPVKVLGCSGLYASALNEGRLTSCDQVTLYNSGEAYELQLSSNFCPGVTTAGAVRIEKVDPDGNGRDNFWILHPPTAASQVTVEVYGVARGKEFRRNTCPDRT
jgi:hypothetical protein